jgi:hypothetical protein
MLPGTPVPGYRLFRPFGTRALPTGLDELDGTDARARARAATAREL